MTGLWELRVRDYFAAAHALRNYHGKCESVHGHNFLVEICVQGQEPDPQTGMLIDFKTLKNLLAQAISDLDHVYVNEIAPFDKKNPSSENIAAYIWSRLEILLADAADPQARKINLKFVRVAENEKQSATYLGPGDKRK